MNLQEKVLETTARLRTQVAALANAAYSTAVDRSELALKRAAKLKASLATLSGAGRELNEVARVHTERFIKENAALARDARKDVSALARATFASLNRRTTVKAKAARKPRAAKRATFKSKSKAA